MQDDDILAAFGKQVKDQRARDKEEKEKKRPKNRLGTRLDLENRPQNFFRGLADRDAMLEQRRQQGFEDTPAELLGDSDKQTFLAGFALAAAFVLGQQAIAGFEQSIADQAVEQGNLELTRCLNDAFGNSERLICYTRYPN